MTKDLLVNRICQINHTRSPERLADPQRAEALAAQLRTLFNSDQPVTFVSLALPVWKYMGEERLRWLPSDVDVRLVPVSFGEKSRATRAIQEVVDFFAALRTAGVSFRYLFSFSRIAARLMARMHAEFSLERALSVINRDEFDFGLRFFGSGLSCSPLACDEFEEEFVSAYKQPSRPRSLEREFFPLLARWLEQEYGQCVFLDLSGLRGDLVEWIAPTPVLLNINNNGHWHKHSKRPLPDLYADR